MSQTMPLSVGEWMLVLGFGGVALAVAALGLLALLVWVGGAGRDRVK